MNEKQQEEERVYWNMLRERIKKNIYTENHSPYPPKPLGWMLGSNVADGSNNSL